jgi:hypothetical protein
MDKEQWIKEVFNSTKKMERLEASPFLAEKILSRIELSKKQGQPVAGFKWALGVVAVLIIGINIIALSKVLHGKRAGSAAIVQQNAGINNSVIYSY